MSSYSISSTGNWLTDSITRNPEGLLLVGAGLALLMRKAVASRPAAPAHSEWSERSGSTRYNNRGGSVSETVKEAAGSVGDYAADISEKATDAVGDYASRAADYATQASERT